MIVRALLTAAALLLLTASTALAAQPNVIVIETDDMDMTGMRSMDNVKELIGEAGVTFDNSLVSFPLCCPSRATFLTGQYAHNNHITSNDPPTGGYQVFESVNSLPAWLQTAGYYTVQVGRYLNHYGNQNPTEIPPGWSEWHASIDPSTYRYYNYTINHQGALVFYGDRPEDYQTDVWAGIADEVVRRRAPNPKPFFMWLAPMAPHDAGPREADDPPERFPTPVPAPTPGRCRASAGTASGRPGSVPGWPRPPPGSSGSGPRSPPSASRARRAARPGRA